MLMNFVITKIVENSLKDDELIKRHLSLKTDKHKFPFRMYDDDGELFFDGLSKINNSFDPLNEMGYSAACTEIHYLEKDKFVRL